MRVMVVDDEPEIASNLARGLEEAGMSVEYFLNGRDALRAARQELAFDVAILDVGLGDSIDGFEVCRQLRQDGAPTAVLMLTARDAVADRLRGFDLGADDYLAKPFVFEEVLARVRALSRRHVMPPGQDTLGLGNVVLHPGSRAVTVAGQPVELSRREFDVLELLLRHVDHYVSREQMHDAIWSYDTDPASGLVEVYIGRLRRRLRDTGATVTVTNSRGVGYRLAVRGEEALT